MFRLTEALNYAKEQGLVGKKKKVLAQELWPESSPRSAYMNFLNLEQGKSKKIDIKNVPYLCERLGVTADYLFGLSDSPSEEHKKEEIVSKAAEVLELARKL